MCRHHPQLVLIICIALRAVELFRLLNLIKLLTMPTFLPSPSSENDFNDTSDIKRKKLANNQAPSSQVATATVTATATAAAAVKSRRSSELQRITEEDVQGTGELSAGYWRELAEKRRLALDASLTENQELHEINASLKEQLDVSNQMLDESRNLVEILSEMLEEGETTGPAGSGFERGESSKSFLHASIAEEAAEVEGIGMVEDSDEATPKGDFDADDEDSRDGVMRTTMRTTAEATTTTDDDDDDVDDKATNAAD